MPVRTSTWRCGGVHRTNIFHLPGRLMSDLEHPVDLVDLDVPSPFVEFLLTEGDMVQIG